MPSILNNTSTPLTSSSIANTFGDSLLSVGKQINKSGIGLSASARQGIEGFIKATQGGYNELFSLATGPSLSVEGMQTQIKGLRASVPLSQISPILLEKLAKEIADAEAKANKEAGLAADGTGLAPSGLGQTVDTEA